MGTLKPKPEHTLTVLRYAEPPAPPPPDAKQLGWRLVPSEPVAAPAAAEEQDEQPTGHENSMSDASGLALTEGDDSKAPAAAPAPAPAPSLKGMMEPLRKGTGLPFDRRQAAGPKSRVQPAPLQPAPLQPAAPLVPLAPLPPIVAVA